MSVFTFTVNCPVTPTPTPTPTPTALPWCCRLYSVRNNTSNTCTINYTTCNNTTTSTTAAAFATVFLGCVREGTITSACSITINTVGACNTPNNTCASTPTPTPTPTPTITLPPTETPLPTYTVTVYASFTADLASPLVVNVTGSGGPVVETAARAYYWLGPPYAATNTLLGGNITSKNCNYLGAVSGVRQGSTFYIGMLSYSYNIPINFTVTNTTCYSQSNPYINNIPIGCGTFLDQGGGYSFTVNSNTTIYLNAMAKRVYSDAKEMIGVNFNKFAQYSLSYCDYNPNISL